VRRAAGGKFPVFPVQPGIFAMFPANRRFASENSQPNQAVASQFPYRPNGNFFAPNRELNAPNRELSRGPLS